MIAPPLLAEATQLTAPEDEVVSHLVNTGAVSAEDVEVARAAREKTRSPYGVLYHLAELKKVPVTGILDALGKVWHMETVDLQLVEPTPEALRTLHSSQAVGLGVLPFHKAGRSLHVAILNPFAIETIQAVRELTSLDPQPYVADEYSLRKALAAAYTTELDLALVVGRAESELLDEPGARSARRIDEAVEAAAIPQMVESFLVNAVRRGASDIHFEFYDGTGRVRYRIDGSLIEINTNIDPRIGAALVNRIKIISELNTAQSHVPEDGTTSLVVDGARMDFRVSTVPTIHGETVVLRVLERNIRFKSIENLEMGAENERLFRAAMRRSQGMILVTGPTGSGKSTTLYTALGQLNQPHRKVFTVEDPPEREMTGVQQLKVRPNERPHLNFDYETALRAILRQDPNVIMVGEIRDPGTAKIALRAAMTGHLVLSTVHTNDTASTVTRLIDIGVEPFNVASAVTLVIAQRLLRRICPRCREPHEPTPALLEFALDAGVDLTRLEGVTLQRGRGCPACAQTGYRGRMGIYEVMFLTPAIKAAIAAGEPDSVIRRLALDDGMVTLKEAGLRCLRDGVTSLEEVATETNF